MCESGSICIQTGMSFALHWWSVYAYALFTRKSQEELAHEHISEKDALMSKKYLCVLIYMILGNPNVRISSSHFILQHQSSI